MAVFGRRGQQASSPRAGAGDVPPGYGDLELVGRGSFSAVYRAHDERLDCSVALKVLSIEGLGSRSLRRFESECRATGRVSAHPHIVTVYDAGTTPGQRPWLAMEYCSPDSLADRVDGSGPLPVADVVQIGLKLGSALEAAHAVGIVHGDVKPQNVLVTAYGEPALADFGIARLAGEGDAVTEITAFTVVHTAPEVLEGHEAVAASDVYSLGSTLWSLLAGRAPYAMEASIGLAPLVTRILRGDVPSLPRTDVPAAVEEALRGAMAVQPADRPASATHLADALTRAGVGLTGAEPPVVAPAPRPAGDAAGAGGRTRLVAPASPPEDSPSAPGRGRGLLVVAGVVALAGAVAGVVWELGRSGPTEPPPEVVDAPSLAPGEASGLSPRQVSVVADSGRLDIAWLLPDPAVIPYVRITPATGEQLQLTPGQESVTVTDVDPGTQYCVTVAGLLSEGGQLTPVPASGDPACGTPR